MFLKIKYLKLWPFIFIFASNVVNSTSIDKEEEYGLVSIFDMKLETGISKLVDYLTQWLENFNEVHLGKSEMGKLLRYDEIKPRVDEINKKSRMMKKSSMALMPLMFQIGATSTWMLLTTLLAAKSVAIGMVLLVFKIAVSSAKISSFFTTLKHHGWSSPAHHETWAPHYESL